MTLRQSAAAGWAAVSDFDGTITLRDVGDALLLHYGYSDKKAIEASYALRGRVEDFMKKSFAGARLSAPVIADFARRRVKARPGFSNFVSFCDRNSIPVQIASGGVDLYALPFLQQQRVNVKSFFGRARVTGTGIKITYPFLRGTNLSAFKASRVSKFKRSGRKVVFFGDGPNDLKAAELADKVFAAGRLLNLCRARGIAASPLTDFNRAVTFLKKAA